MKAATQVRSRLRRAAPERLRLLVKEVGSATLTSSAQAAFDETLVIAQMHGELPAAFAQRTIERIAAVERSGRRFASTSLLTGDRRDAGAKAARRLIALALAHHVHSVGERGELVLEATAETSDQRRHELLGLVDELITTPDTGVRPIQLRFGSTGPCPPPLESGVFWSTPTPKS